MLEVRTAKAWHLRPSEFWRASETDQVFMIQLEMTESAMRAWEMQLQEEERERAASRSGRPRHR